MTVPLASAGSAAWYLARSTGAVSLILLTLVVVLGVVDVRRWSSPRWPRFLLDALHRNAALLAMAFLAVHILMSVIDGFAPIGLTDAVIPFKGAYRPFWLGLGAVAFDLLLAVAITSMLRQHLGYGSWRAVHWLSYAAWPVALVHGLGTGSDVKDTWLLTLSIACLLAVVAAVVARLVNGAVRDPRHRGLAFGGTGAFCLFLAVWLPGGPLGSEWARRSGTPKSLLTHGRAPAHKRGR